MDLASVSRDGEGPAGAGLSLTRGASYLPEGAAVWLNGNSSLHVITADVSPSPLITSGDCLVSVP